VRSSATQDHSSLCLFCRETSEGKGRLKGDDEGSDTEIQRADRWFVTTNCRHAVWTVMVVGSGESEAGK
jgi:hypothetical protein